MCNKACVFTVIFFFLCIQVFPQIDSGDQEENTTIDDFIDGFWYRRYLSIENLAEYYEYRAFLSEMRENNEEDFRKGVSESFESIQYLYEIVMGVLDDEDRRIKQKLDILKENFESDEEVIDAASMYESFSLAIAENTFPADDSVLWIIDELYSRLITRARYVLLEKHRDVYDVVEGDYLKKIAERVYENENLWKLIYNANIDNRSFLPNPNNPDLILPGVNIRIPPIASNGP